MNLSRWFLICAALAIAAACSSGSTSVTPHSTASAGAGAGSTAVLNKTVNFTVDIPPAAPVAPAAGKFHKLGTSSTVYLSPNTGSIAINLVAVNGISLAQPPPAQPATNVPASCRGSATGCHVSVPNVVAATGINTYTVTTFAGSNGEGAVVSTGVISVTVTTSGTVSTIGGDPTELALGGYVASLSLTVAPQSFTFGVPGKATVVVTPKDAAGATIVGNAQFAFPIVLSVSGTGFTLSGPGLQSDGTIELLEPEAPSPPIVLAYNGTGSTSAVLTATSQDGAGATVAAPPVTVAVPTPVPTPTSTSVTTLPPLSPSPMGSGPTPAPTGTPSSVYVLNAYDSSIFEFSEPVNGNYSESPRRGFGGTSLLCKGLLTSLLGITTDPSANVYVGSPAAAFDICPAQFYKFAPTFSGPGAPAPIPLSVPSASSELGELFQLQYDAPNGGKLDVGDDTGAYFVTRVPTTGSPANPTLGYPFNHNTAAEGCFISSGLPTPDPTCGNGGGTSFFDDAFDQNPNTPFAVGSDGSLYVLVTDEYASANPLSPFGNEQAAIIKVPPSEQLSTGTITAESAWIEGPNTLMSYPVAIAYDAAKNSLWVLDGGIADDYNNSRPATPPPIAGPGVYLLEFPLSAFGGVPGPQNITPTAFLSGQKVSRFEVALAPLGSLTIEPNAVAVGDGNVFVANQGGPFDGVTSTPPPPPYNGEVDVYSDATTGINQNTVAPIAIYYGGTVRGPLDVAFGPHGAALGSGPLFGMPSNLPALRARFIENQRRMSAVARQRAQLRRQLRRR